MTKCLECVVCGRVQMVTFRAFTRRNARCLGLVGTVQNISDGSVHIIAEGEESDLQELLAKIHQGPSFARVDSVEESWGESTGKFTTFNIVYKNIWDRI